MKWEYYIGEPLGGQHTKDLLNEMGEEGWELVQVTKDQAIFKRPKEEAQYSEALQKLHMAKVNAELRKYDPFHKDEILTKEQPKECICGQNYGGEKPACPKHDA